MTIVQKIGLIVFVVGFSLFNLVFWASDYQLSHETLVKAIPNEKHQANVWQFASNMKNKHYESTFGFVSDLSDVFDKVNRQAIQTFGISEIEIGILIAMSERGKLLRVELTTIENLFGGRNEVSTFKREAFKQFGGWVIEKEFTSRKELQKALKEVANNIEKYAIIQEKGLDKYAIRQYTYAITKASAKGWVKEFPVLTMMVVFGCSLIGAVMYILPMYRLPAETRNNGVFNSDLKHKGWLGVLLGMYLIVFYLMLYFYPYYMVNWVLMLDPLSKWLNGNEATEFFFYGFLYTICVLVMGVRMLMRYKDSRYQVLKTISVMFFQLCFAFIIPEILVKLHQPPADLKHIWPLDYDFFFDTELNKLLASGKFGVFLLGWGIALFVVAVPVLTYFYGKRWYCSWVCGCGGLAETLGDPYRHLSNKSLKAWQIERWMVHGVLAFAVIMTIAVLYTFLTGQAYFLGIDTYSLREIYGVWIGAGFAGVVGTGFYPFMGNRVWCRFGCPLAAYLGIVQRFKSRFQISTNGGQCISCGNCSTYCEMGIDVRWYAQRGQNIVRASCVGCGICANVCPRGVLKLENVAKKPIAIE